MSIISCRMNLPDLTYSVTSSYSASLGLWATLESLRNEGGGGGVVEGCRDLGAKGRVGMGYGERKGGA